MKRYAALPVTTTVLTARGRHLYFWIEVSVRCSVGKLGEGFDVRGEGGYAVGPWSTHPSGVPYRYQDGKGPSQLAPAPQWLLNLLVGGSSPPEAPRGEIIPEKERGRAHSYADAARRRELDRLAKAPKHQRNDTLNLCAFKLGQLAAWRLLDPSQITRELTDVSRQIGLEENEIGPTIASGLTKGIAQPRRLPFMPVTSVAEEDRAAQPEDFAGRLSHLGENDADNAQRFVKRVGDQVLWTAGRGWLVYAGGRWRRDATNEVNRLAELTARAIAHEVACLQREPERSSRARFATTSLSRAALSNMLELAKPFLGAEDDTFDQDPWLLNTRNGTVDLRTGERYQHDPRDLITRITRVAYRRKAKCPQFLQFLQTIFKGDEETIAFVHRVLGYTLTGITREQVFFLLLGDGENGKSTLMNLFRDLLGEYGVHTPTETLMVRQHDNMIPNDLARLVGKRMVTAAEQHWKRQLDEAKIKAMTGGEPITARFMRAEFFEFTPAFKLFIAANDPPRVRSTSKAFWRRAVVIPFDVKIPEADIDQDLSEKLKGEGPGILAWALKGCLAWQAEGLKPPAAIKAAAGGWQRSVDFIDRFAREELVLDDDHVVTGSQMYARFKAFCAEGGEVVPTVNAFVKRLRDDLNFTYKRTRRGSEWVGVKLRR